MEEYQWALKWVQLEFPMLTEGREVKKFLKQEMTRMWAKMAPFILRRRQAEDLQVRNVEEKNQLLRRLEDPRITPEGIEEVYEKNWAAGEDGQGHSLRGKG